MGGKINPSIHLDTNEYGSITIYTKDYVLKNIKKNMLYQEVGIMVTAKQNISTYEIHDIKFKQFVEYSPVYDKNYLNKLIELGTETWKDVKDTDNWLKDIRKVL
jgi:hypothetical protein